MIYLIKCENPSGVRINSIGVSLSKGQTMDCQKSLYDSNKEIQTLVSTGMLSMSVKQTSTNLHARAGAPKPNPRRNQPQVVERVVERVIEREAQPDMDALTQNLLAQLGTMLSPELLAQAIAKQLPTQQVVTQVAPNAPSSQFTSSDGEELTFIPSKIISDTTKSSSTSTVTESSGSDDNLSDALKALKALRKAQK